MSITPRERRRYYRVNDVVLLHYEVLSEGTATAASAHKTQQGDNLKLDSAQLLKEIDRELNESIELLWRLQPEMGRAIGLLNRKLAVLSRALDSDEGFSLSYDDTPVNVSGCGIAFLAKEPLALDTHLRLQLVLQPSGIEVSLNGSVVGCETHPDYEHPPRWWIRVDFDDDQDAQERLIQHIVHKQADLLAAARQSAQQED